MRTAIISDIHANLEALRAILNHARDAGAGEIVCLGDVVGYNADPGACVAEIRDHPDTRCLLGNHDAMAVGSGPLGGITEQARLAMIWTRENLSDADKAWLAGLPLTLVDPDVTYCHASLEAPTAWRYVQSALDAARHFAYQETRVGFIGHSHMVFAWREDGDRLERLLDSALDTSAGDRWLISVGSVGQPRDGDPRAGYVLFDHESGRATQHRVDYDVATAQRKILATGLPIELADRLG